MSHQPTVSSINLSSRILLLLGIIMSLSACYRLPFLPHRQIDSFQPVAEQVTETMEIRGITYVRVVKPGSRQDQEQPATIWIPLDVFRSGKYQPYESPLVKQTLAAAAPAPATTAEQPATAKNPNTAGLTPDMSATGTKNVMEEQLAEAKATAKSLPLRRRGILFPSRATNRYPQITSQLIMDLEQQLPLTMLPLATILPRSDSWQTNDTDELITQSKRWLKSVKNLPPAQLLFFLTQKTSSSYLSFLVTILDAQSAKPVASFSFIINPVMGRVASLVPPRPQPLIQLVLTSPWWCSATPGHDKKTVFLAAGQKSRVTTGLHLRLCQPAEKIFDPRDKTLLGFAIGKPFAEAVVTDFFGQDGSIATLRSAADVPAGGCLAVPFPE